MAEHSYASIPSYIRGRFRRLNGPDSQAIAGSDALSASPAGVDREQFLKTSPFPHDTSLFLCQLDMKLDLIISSLRSDKLVHDFPHELEVLEIGAGKLTIRSSAPLRPDDHLEVLLYLSSGFTTASGIGKIQDIIHGPDGELAEFVFTKLFEEEREKIISYVFMEERRLLREKRL